MLSDTALTQLSWDLLFLILLADGLKHRPRGHDVSISWLYHRESVADWLCKRAADLGINLSVGNVSELG